ncbi:MAG: hypothetical protein ACJASX_004261, partial [Limisphaerales bacterium]
AKSTRIFIIEWPSDGRVEMQTLAGRKKAGLMPGLD